MKVHCTIYVIQTSKGHFTNYNLQFRDLLGLDSIALKGHCIIYSLQSTDFPGPYSFVLKVHCTVYSLQIFAKDIVQNTINAIQYTYFELTSYNIQSTVCTFFANDIVQFTVYKF